MAPLTSSDLNYLVYRYLHESGFTHAAFCLGYEAGLLKTTIDANLVPPGALVTFVQKGIQYLELEANSINDDADVEADFQFLQPLDLITKNVSELQKIIKERKEKDLKDKSKGKEIHSAEADRELEREVAKEREKEKEKEQREKERRRERERMEIDKEKEKPREVLTDTKHNEEKRNNIRLENGSAEEAEPMEICTNSTLLPSEFSSSDVLVLEGHSSEVFACAWSPAGPLLASGSGDSTGRIWTVGDGPCGSRTGPLNAVVLKHFKGRTNEKSKDVTTLDWNDEGTLLATGSYDGQARIWNQEGELISTLNKHKGPIFSLKWNKKGDYLLSGSVDRTAIVWDVNTGEWKQQFEFHAAPTLDVDWRNNNSFATCSTDNKIYICKVGENRPIKCFTGHEGEVNAIKWDPTGSLLASCSDDFTAKIWSMKQDNWVHDLREHTKEIYTIRWSPTGPGTCNPNQQLVLARCILYA
ncbi:hypothetical protein Leryth_008742 [Lithospermum erythrorhizon]|nr:hypothetical protein Leryth_008742 [Lithospermum erythrorhizon]